MRAKFEEKTYENYFNEELGRRTDIYFPLGQVQEGRLGFDASALSSSRRLWRRLGHPYWFFVPFSGVDLREIADHMERILEEEISELPRMKANLLFQYKRPEYFAGRNAKEYELWKSPYYRYDIYAEQQNLLMNVYREFKDRILINYAAPAIHEISVLVQRHQSRQVIENSNFQPCHRLEGHHRNTYVAAGVHSIACSEPENLEYYNLLNVLAQYGERRTQEENNRQFITNFRKLIIGIVSEDAFYGSSIQLLNEEVGQIAQYPLFYSFLVMQNVKQVTGIQWLIKL